jgi:PAS domain S-box-containing protein
VKSAASSQQRPTNGYPSPDSVTVERILDLLRTGTERPSRQRGPSAARRGFDQKLVAALEFSRLLFDVAPSGVLVVAEDGNIVAANQAIAQLVGGTVDQLRMQNFRDLPSWKNSDLLHLADEAFATRMGVDGEAHIETTFGRDVWAAVRMVPFGFPSEQLLLVLFTDITEPKRIEKQNAAYVAKLEASLAQTVAVIRSLSEMRDPYTAGHERRVGDLAGEIGRELGLGARQQEGLRVAGYLHDVGKITVPAEILAKPRSLTAAEFDLVKEHSAAGYEILKNVEFPWPVAIVALQHHERMDGSGYPRGLSGDAISLEARVVAVADVVEAMASHRPYRPALGISEALATIEQERGTLFDPAVVDACLRLFVDQGYTI